ncbi:hypothetical protein A5881_003998 [Enterococcus termitis]|nr:hypothetical protein A5881_003977 [Enterococcus termitis]
MSYNVQPLRSIDEINDFLFFLRRNKFAKRDVFLFLFGINTGLRMSDIVNRKVSDIKYSSTPQIIEKKTGKKRTLYLESMQSQIEDYIENMDDNDWLFPSRKGQGHLQPKAVYQIFQKVAAGLERDDIGTHTLRKTFGYHYYKRTKDIVFLMEIFGHSNQQITKRYIGITQDEISDSLKNFRLGF